MIQSQHFEGYLIVRNLRGWSENFTASNLDGNTIDKNFLICICLRRRLFRVTLEITRTVINFAYRDIVTSQRGHWPLLIRTRYVCTCVGAGSGMGGGISKMKAIRWGAYYYSLVLNVQPCKYDMYKSSLRHIRGLLEKYLTVFFYANTWWIII
jgi:hypothetical protein